MQHYVLANPEFVDNFSKKIKNYIEAIFLRMRALYIVWDLCSDWFRQYISPVNHRCMSSQWWRNVGREGAKREGSYLQHL